MAKILIISDNYVPLLKDKVMGGAEATLMNQLAILTEKGHEIRVIAPDDSDIDLKQLVPIGEYSKVWYNEIGSGAPRTLNKLTNQAIDNEMRFFKPDLVLNHHKQPSVIKHLSLYSKTVPVVSHVHNAPIFGMLSVNTNKAYAQLAQARGKNWGVSGWCTRMNNGLVDGCVTDTFIMQIALERKTVNLPEYSAVTVGRFVDWKNLHTGIEAITSGKLSGRVVGYSEDPEDDYWLTKIKPLVEGNENWLTGITHAETMDVVSRAVVFLQTSHLETSSCTQFEAAQHGVPSIVVTKRNGHGSFEDSFLPDWAYIELDNYRKGGAFTTDKFVELYNLWFNSETGTSLPDYTQLEVRQKLADYIYDNFNKEVWYSKFVAKVNDSFKGQIL